MPDQPTELFEKIRQQFDGVPYLNVPLEVSPKDQPDALFFRNLLTPYYLRNRRLTSTAGKTILDAGCGTGFKSLMLAEANPGAKIVGIDLSSNSIEFAKQRLTFHGFENAEFVAAAIEDLPTLGFEFDYIHCDEVLSLVPDPIASLQAMKAVLKPEGIIRANLHSSLHRAGCFRSQQIFKTLGLMDKNPDDAEVEAVIATFNALQDWVQLKARVWKGAQEENKESILMNYLLQGDKGFTIANLFAALRAADLEFIHMVNWRQWELLDLFQQSDGLPPAWTAILPNLAIEQRLQLFEQLHPVHRLLDFYCGHPNPPTPAAAIADWSNADWETARIHLHPQLKTAQIRDDLIRSTQRREPFQISRYVVQARSPLLLRSTTAACLLPLWDAPQTVAALVDRFLTLQPIDLVRLEPIDRQQIVTDLKALLIQLEDLLYVLIERNYEE